MKRKKKFWRRELIKNRITAVGLVLLGLTSLILVHEPALFIITLWLGTILFFEKENRIG